MPSKITTADGRLTLAYPGHVSVAQPGSLTDELATVLGERFRLYTGGKNVFQGKDALVQAGGCETGRYAKTNQLADGAHPDSWYSYKRDATGTVVRRHDSRWNVYSMEPSNRDWRAFHAAVVENLFAAHPDDECWFQDSAGTFSYTQGITRGETGPLLPDHKTLYPKAAWFDAVRDNLDTWSAAHPDRRMLLNGLDGNTLHVYQPGVGQIEGAFHSVSGVLPTLSVWERTVMQLREAQAVGWTPWVYCKLPSWKHADLWRPLMITTALLADEGSLVYGVTGIEGTAQSWEVPEYDHSWYSLDLGVPLSPTMLRQGTLAYRYYDNGFLVVANPDTREQVLSPPDGGSVTIAPQSGGIFERSTTWLPV